MILQLSRKLTDILCSLSHNICEATEQRKEEFKWLKSHNELVTKQDLIKMERRIMAKLDDLVAASTALSVAADSLSVKIDVQNVKIDALIVALAPVDLPPAAEAALAAVQASTAKSTAAGDKVDAEIIKLDAALGTPVVGIPGTPVITQQPVSQVAQVGNLVTLSVVATGNNLAYQWKFNGEPIVGATSANLVIQAAALTDAGTYTVTISNEAGSVTSNNDNLTVNA